MVKNQEIIYNLIQTSQEHLTADDIYMQCRKAPGRMSLATVYRSLGILVEQGRIAKISISGQPDHYDKSMVKHEHLLCVGCGKMVDVHIPDLKSVLEQQTGQALEGYDLCMRYICSHCRELQRQG
jgi:Fe2+ or Zn2+ uptake regulation protein